MVLFHRSVVAISLVITDVAVLAFSVWAANLATGLPFAWLDLAHAGDLRPQLVHVLILVGIVVVWPILYGSYGLYRERYQSFLQFRTYHVLEIFKAVTLGTVLVVAAILAVDQTQVRVDFVLGFWTLNFACTLLTREIFISVLREFRLHGRNLRHLLIVGSNQRAAEFARRINEHPELGYRLRGFVDEPEPGSEQALIDGVGRVASFEELSSYLGGNVVDEVLIALPLATLYEEASRIVKTCETHGIVVHFAPGVDFLNVGSSHFTFATFDDEPVITLIPPTIVGWRAGVKRAVDIMVSSFLLIALMPVLLAVALAVKLTSPGSVLFVQDRTGLFKRTIRVFKFRTMTENADAMQAELDAYNEASGPVFKIANDPRLTKIGSFLRRMSLDELPQLFNVLRGDMSLVGPRPMPLRDYAGFDQDWHRRRFSVRPGITCIWQVSGRSGIPFDRWMELDMEYINNWSLWLDFKILLQTVPAVFLRRGAA